MNRYLRKRSERRMLERDGNRPMMRDGSRPMRRMRDSYYPSYEDYGDRPLEFMGYGSISRNRGGYRDYDYDYGDDEDREYLDNLHKWEEDLKRRDKYGMTKSQVVEQAKVQHAKMDTYDEEELYVAYLMMATDHKDLTNDPTNFIKMAIDFLEDDDVALRGSEKMCAYLYSIVLGEE